MVSDDCVEIYARQELNTKKSCWFVYLAGPVQGASDWQEDVPIHSKVTWISPRMENGGFDDDIVSQVKWETLYMRMADIIVFWIPAQTEEIKGRDYAQTTRTEFGEYLARGKKIFFGCYEGFPGERYFRQKLVQYDHSSYIFRTLNDCLTAVLTFIEKEENSTPSTYYTSDTHFSSKRALEFSKRPFSSVEEMDLTMIERWNNVVHPNDTVYHLGDFGNPEKIKYLNGNIHFVVGNYEREGKELIPDDIIECKNYIIKNNKILVHEPSLGLNIRNSNPYILDHCIILFGHTHGRQKLKEWKGMDVGVDCNNFTPVSEGTVNFYMSSMEAGFYDQENWF